MSSRLKESIIIILFAAAFTQIYLNNILTHRTNEKSQYTSAAEPIYKDLSQLNKEISILKNAAILNAHKENNIWCVEVKLSGGKQEILEDMKKLEKYEIKNYAISKNNTENCVIIDLYGIKQE